MSREPKQGEQVTYFGAPVFATHESSCEGCVVLEKVNRGHPSTCGEIWKQVPRCSTFIWVTEIDYLKRQMRGEL